MARIISAGCDDSGRDQGCQVCGNESTYDIEDYYSDSVDGDIVQLCTNCREQFDVVELPDSDVLPEDVFDTLYKWAYSEMVGRQLEEAPSSFHKAVMMLVRQYRIINNYKEDEPMDGDAVDRMISEVSAIANIHQGNI